MSQIFLLESSIWLFSTNFPFSSPAGVNLQYKLTGAKRSTLMRWGRIALWVLALLPSVTIALLSVWFLATSLGLRGVSPYPIGPEWMAVAISGGTLIVSIVSLISTIWLAWRKERRDSREYTLKIQQLEMQLTELRATKNSSSTPPVAP